MFNFLESLEAAESKDHQVLIYVNLLKPVLSKFCILPVFIPTHQHQKPAIMKRRGPFCTRAGVLEEDAAGCNLLEWGRRKQGIQFYLLLFDDTGKSISVRYSLAPTHSMHN